MKSDYHHTIENNAQDVPPEAEAARDDAAWQDLPAGEDVPAEAAEGPADPPVADAVIPGHRTSRRRSAIGLAGEREQTINQLRKRLSLALAQQQATERALRASEARTQAILGTAPDCVIGMDANGNIVEFNPAAERTFGYSRAEALGQPVAELIVPPDLRERHRRGLARYLATGHGPVLGRRLELRGMRKDGSEFPVELTIARVPLDGPPFFAAHLRDISDRVRAEEERTRLYEAERAARKRAEIVTRRLRALQAITDTALMHLSVGDLAQRLIERIRDVMRVDSVAILLMSPDERSLTVYSALEPEAAVAEQVSIPIGEGIAGTIAATRQPMVVDNLDTVEVVNPVLREHLRSLAGAPLLSGDRVLGVLQLGTKRVHHFTDEEIHLLELVAQRVALAIEDAYLYDAERTARAAAERAQRRFEFLAEAGAMLVSSLDCEESLTRLAWMIVGCLADACFIDVREEDGSITRLALAHRDREKLDVLRHIRARRPLETAPTHPITRVLETGEARLIVEVSDDQLAAAAGDDRETLAALRALGYRSAICAPLRARGWIVGALTLISDTPHHEFGLDDLALAEDLGLRAGLALDNARLLRQTQRALVQVGETADQLLMQATQLDAIIQAIPGIVYVCDAHGRITRVNPSGAAVLGLEPAKGARPNARTLSRARVFSPDGTPLPPEDYPLAQALRGETSADFRCMMRRFDTGEEVQLLVSFAPIRDGTGAISGAVAVGNDVTEIYRLDQQKDEFLSIASHELKTPLTSLKILAQLTRRRLSRGESRDVEQLAGMDRAIERMERLVNDLLDVSRIQEGKLALRLEPWDLAALARQVAEEQMAASDREIALELPDGRVMATVDVERIEQVLTNLLSNALKYSPPGCPVTLTLAVEDDETAHFVVRDEGAGIPLEHQAHLFERFFRVPGVEVQVGSGVGLGLGLYISREIVERHHGRIWVVSDVGQGAAFHFTLPLAGGSDDGS